MPNSQGKSKYLSLYPHMKTIEVVASIIVRDGEVFVTQGMAMGRTDGNFQTESISTMLVKYYK